MRVLYVGNFKHAHCTEVQIAATLEDMGHVVTRAQENETNAERVLADAPGHDLLLWTRTWGLTGDGHRLIAKCPIPTAAYHLDFYAGLERGARVSCDPWWRCRYVFTPDGGSDEWFAAHGVRHHYIRPGVLASGCYLGLKRREYAHDVVFVGSRSYHPEWSHRGELIDWLADTYGARFGKYGNPGRCIWDAELNECYATAKVVVGDSLCPMDRGGRHRDYWSNRPYETTGRGGFLLFPRVPGIERDFVDGEHLRLFDFGDWAGLKAMIDHYVAHDAERERIRLAGHEHTKATHTFHHRLAEALAIVRAGEPGLPS
jgi:hypothetical protein